MLTDADGDEGALLLAARLGVPVIRRPDGGPSRRSVVGLLVDEQLVALRAVEVRPLSQPASGGWACTAHVRSDASPTS